MFSFSNLLLLIAMVYPTIMAWLYFVVAAPPPDAPKSSSPLMQSLYAMGKVVQFSLPVAAWWIADRSRFRIRRPNWSALRPAMAFAILSAIGIVGVYHLFLKGHWILFGMSESLRGKAAELGIDSPGRFLWFAVFISMFHALLEEYYWRAYVFEGLRPHLSLGTAIAISSFAFMAHHVVILRVYTPERFWTGTVPLALGVGLGGAVWAWIYHRAGSIAPGWLSHAIIDSAIMVVGYDLIFCG